MTKKSFEEIPFYNHELKELLEELRKKITKYNGKYNSKEFKEYLEALLMLDIDILKENAYKEEYKNISIYERIINFNIYGSMRKFISNLDKKIVWPGAAYNEDVSYYPALKKEEVLSVDTFSKNEKVVITLPPETLISPDLRHQETDRLIEQLYNESKSKPNFKSSEKYHYMMKLGNIIKQLSLLNSCESMRTLTNNQKKTNLYNNELYKEIEKEYGPFKNTFRLDHNNEEISVDVKGNIIGLSTVKETPIAIFQKKYIYH